MKTQSIIFALALPIALAACDNGPASAFTDEMADSVPNEEFITGAKDECTTMAGNAAGGIADAAALGELCSCTVDELIENGEFATDAEPSEAVTTAAMTKCLEEYQAAQTG